MFMMYRQHVIKHSCKNSMNITQLLKKHISQDVQKGMFYFALFIAGRKKC